MGAEASKECINDTEKYHHDMEERRSSSFANIPDAALISESLRHLKLDDSEIAARYAGLTPGSLAKYSKGFWEDDKNKLALNAAMNNDLTQFLVNRRCAVSNQHVFNVKLDLEGKITNQKSSGRCWLFAGTNVLRLQVIRRYKLKDDFELSQSYLFFYDKLEKANWFLENMIDLADKDIDDRVVQYLLTSPVGDGGQWDMFVNIVEKYGVCPQSAYPETFASSNTRRLNWLVTVKLREFASKIRKALNEEGATKSHVRVIKDQMMQDIYRIMVICLGEPPATFDWETVNEDGKYVGIKNLTPLTFFKDVVKYPIADTLSLINDPRNEYSALYTVDRLGNVVGGHPIRYINTTIETIKTLAINVLKSGNPVWFGCDVGQFSNNALGVMDTEIYDYALAFNVDFSLTKKGRVLYGESLMTHAMVFTGVHLGEDGKPIRWRVENSWGETTGDKGYWIMSDDWFSSFVYQVVLEKSFVPRTLVSLLDTKPSILPAYDPMGALA